VIQGQQEKVCERCGAIFHRTTEESHNWRNKRFCGKQCKYGAISEQLSTAPPEDILRDLYLEQRLPSNTIGKRFGVAAAQVRRWLKAYGIERRPSGCSMANRGITAPTKEQLEHVIHVEHQSMKEIAIGFSVDKSAIRYWILKYGIKPSTAWLTRRRGYVPQLPDRDEMQRLYDELGSTREIGELFDVDAAFVQKHCRKVGVPLKDSGYNNGIRFQCRDGHEVRSSYEQSVDNWLFAKGYAHTYEPKLPFGKNQRADFLVGFTYIEVWGVLNSSRYNEKRERKIDLYAIHNLPLIGLEPQHFKDQCQDMERILSERLNAAPSGWLF
jgi:hypothetical protein